MRSDFWKDQESKLIGTEQFAKWTSLFRYDHLLFFLLTESSNFDAFWCFMRFYIQEQATDVTFFVLTIQNKLQLSGQLSSHSLLQQKISLVSIFFLLSTNITNI